MKLYKKIDIYLRPFQKKVWEYECSTNWSKTCKEAKIKFCTKHGLDSSQVKAVFAKQ